jgi:type I restriction enzyme S subunit
MKYRLGDICSITKGETGIMKAIPGAYTMVTLGEANKTHNEFQFDTKAVIVPLVSSTGHGHASMKRVKYQEGKFALGSILCAVIPKDEKIVLAKYLHIYLHWNREELLVSKMKGMANVSLPMNKIADVLVIVPSIDKQQKIIDLEVQLVNKEIQLERLLSDQLYQIENLNQAILQEAVQGKLLKQDPKDELASELLKRIKDEKAKSGKKEKPLPPIKPEEIPFDIPKNWIWCRLGEMFDIERGSSPRPKGDPRYFSKSKTPFNWITISDMTAFAKDAPLSDTREYLTELGTKHSRYVTTKDIIIVASGSAGRTSLLGINGFIYDGLMSVKNIEFDEMRFFLYYLFRVFEASMMQVATGATWQNINTDILKSLLIPLPPLSEQRRIVVEIEKQLSNVKQLKEHIILNQQATEQLLKALLHQAFEVKGN